MSQLNEDAKRSLGVARHTHLLTGDPKHVGHPRDGLHGALRSHGFSDGEATAVHSVAGHHLVNHHGMAHDAAARHLNGEHGKRIAAEVDKTSAEHAVKHVRAVIDRHLAGG